MSYGTGNILHQKLIFRLVQYLCMCETVHLFALTLLDHMLTFTFVAIC